MGVRWISMGGFPALISETVNPGQRLSTIAASPDERLSVFALAVDGGVCHLWQAEPGVWMGRGHWTMRGCPSGVTFGGPDPERRVGPVVGRNADGRLEIFALGDDGAVWHLWQLPNRAWLAPQRWLSRGRPAAAEHADGVVLLDLAVEPNADGRLEIFAAGADGAVWHTHQRAPNGDWVPGWASLGRPPGVRLEALAAGRNEDGRLEVFAAGDDGAIWQLWQTSPNGPWSPPGAWLRMAPPPSTALLRPSVIRSIDGRLHVLATGADGAIWHRCQLSPNGVWVDRWTALGAEAQRSKVIGSPAVHANGDGGLEVFAWLEDGTIQRIYQTRADAPFRVAEGWGRAGVDPLAPAGVPAVGRNADGRLEVLVIDADTGEMRRALQTPGGGWM